MIQQFGRAVCNAIILVFIIVFVKNKHCLFIDDDALKDIDVVNIK